jgi:hypothetical protein
MAAKFYDVGEHGPPQRLGASQHGIGFHDVAATAPAITASAFPSLGAASITQPAQHRERLQAFRRS